MSEKPPLQNNYLFKWWEYVTKIVEILIDCLDKSINKLKDKVNRLKALSIPKTFSKLEQRIYSFIYESSLFTDFGVNSSDIMNNTNSSKRTIIYTLNKFKEQKLLIETKIGKFTYYKMNIDNN